jgi:hypothetical protein
MFAWWEDMVGACNGMLCLLDVMDDAESIVELFTHWRVHHPAAATDDRELA